MCRTVFSVWIQILRILVAEYVPVKNQDVGFRFELLIGKSGERFLSWWFWSSPIYLRTEKNKNIFMLMERGYSILRVAYRSVLHNTPRCRLGVNLLNSSHNDLVQLIDIIHQRHHLLPSKNRRSVIKLFNDIDFRFT